MKPVLFLMDITGLWFNNYYHEDKKKQENLIHDTFRYTCTCFCKYTKTKECKKIFQTNKKTNKQIIGEKVNTHQSIADQLHVHVLNNIIHAIS